MPTPAVREIPLTTVDGSIDIHIYDMQRIEVLEGPQGTLFGASSESGTIRFISNKPDATKFSDGYDVKGDYVVSHNGGYELEGFINIYDPRSRPQSFDPDSRLRS